MKDLNIAQNRGFSHLNMIMDNVWLRRSGSTVYTVNLDIKQIYVWILVLYLTDLEILGRCFFLGFSFPIYKMGGWMSIT